MPIYYWILPFFLGGTSSGSACGGSNPPWGKLLIVYVVSNWLVNFLTKGVHISLSNATDTKTTQKRFQSMRIKELGFEQMRTAEARYWAGLKH